MYVDISVYTCLATSACLACAMFLITVAISPTSSETIVSNLYYLLRNRNAAFRRPRRYERRDNRL